MKKRTRSKSRYSNKGALWWPRIQSYVIVAFAVWFFLVVALRVVAPPFTPLMIIRSAQAWLSGAVVEQRWQWIPLERIPRAVQQAVVAAEDARFMEHWGIDFGALEDVLDDASDVSRVRGASTITMQTVKNIFLWPGRSYLRKIIEGVIAPIAGVVWGKKRTLELYLNVIEWGEGIYGIDAAARRYYAKSAANLSPAEAASLASILPNPRALDPIHLSKGAERRFKRIVREAHQIRVP